MSTIDNKQIIDEIIERDGYYFDDPRVYMIVEYINAYGKTTWGITYCTEGHSARTRYLNETQYVRKPRVIWHSEMRLLDGKEKNI